jgi:HNH endonuclease
MTGLCQCGCGIETSIATRNRKDRGWVKGEPVPFIHGHNPTLPLLTRIGRFWSRVKLFPTSGWPDCLEWGGFINANGYGVCSCFNGISRSAHRVAYILTFGPIPDGLEPDHLCKNTACINPFHLEPVTKTVNIRRSSITRLSETLAVEIRTSTESERTIARRLGVHRCTVNAVRRGVTWRLS